MTDTLTVSGLTYELRRSDRRNTLGITVDRDGSLILTAPKDCSEETIQHIARKKELWVQTKLAEKRLLFRPRPPKEYVTGENFHYLGRSHRLLLVDTGDDPAAPALRLRRGRFELQRDQRHRADAHFIAWYIRNGRPWIRRRVNLLADRTGVSPISIDIRDLGYRWGSCGPKANLNFHWRTVCLPPRLIEYVIVHELVHLLEPHHGAEFWKRMERVIPDYAARKRWLAENGHRF